MSMILTVEHKFSILAVIFEQNVNHRSIFSWLKSWWMSVSE
jgi:hypothetical protein